MQVRGELTRRRVNFIADGVVLLVVVERRVALHDLAVHSLRMSDDTEVTLKRDPKTDGLHMGFEANLQASVCSRTSGTDCCTASLYLLRGERLDTSCPVA